MAIGKRSALSSGLSASIKTRRKSKSNRESGNRRTAILLGQHGEQQRELLSSATACVCGLKISAVQSALRKLRSDKRESHKTPKFHSQNSLLAGSVAASMTASYLYDSITIVVLRAQL